MSIQILSPQLANQIAAGEVVERPASVVKELVENCLDAGATSIEIEIDRGGHKGILIRDNGKGIPQQELELALSRHATSKISKLDDLENICSLGFRGEALASISSVSRLTLTSKPESQSQAWQACAEGREMKVTLQPAAHPKGTSIEVLDLFFNTPARRKFLRAEKTEFTHIDEVIRRIALSRFDVALSLKHNGKTVRKYPAIKEGQSALKRISAVCGSDFADHAIPIDSEYAGICLKGWLSAAGASRAQNDLQYVYVNGRVMKDKLINHAIRQAYEGLIEPNTHPAFVLFLTLDPTQVDVNVHPAKHEVRFHQSRLVHDLIFRSVSKSLSESFTDCNDNTQNEETLTQVTHTTLEEVAPTHQYIRPLSSAVDSSSHNQTSSQQRAEVQEHGVNRTPKAFNYSAPAPHSKSAAKHYGSLMTAQAKQQSSANLPRHLLVADNRLLIEWGEVFYLCKAPDLAAKKLKADAEFTPPVMQPLLMPISLTLEQVQLTIDDELLTQIKQLGIDLSLVNQRLLLKQVPSGTRALDWASVLLSFFDALNASHKQKGNTPHIDAKEGSAQESTTASLPDCFYSAVADYQIKNLNSNSHNFNDLFEWLHKQANATEILKSCATIIPLNHWLSQFDE
ncbi:DNA mismatch repair endonuclease MutL [Aliiglaciecola sp. 3_MG-2023]|uniref:DNA mismatch repair endonuclease MutL n=1 Tax=Aliiglaciecola sp. 3_MG-2023 TaxID=3062644 RepID=UPI0026E3A98A|nr:DNA mismatch repair endonuclease MutL [Aliiglaciecola sp. 3_MG-2023]MDO6694869.1 DNA mismatch repair endonuclease MutL [Aliiglaciecola sp. 3_MG-2023]